MDNSGSSVPPVDDEIWSWEFPIPTTGEDLFNLYSSAEHQRGAIQRLRRSVVEDDEELRLARAHAREARIFDLLAERKAEKRHWMTEINKAMIKGSRDRLKGKNSPPGINNDIEEKAVDRGSSGPENLPLKWAHPVSAPINGCLLIATEKLDGVRFFERTVILLLRSGTKNPQEGPFGVVVNRPLHMKMKDVNPTTSIQLATTFAECALHFGGPLDRSMFLLRAVGTTGLPGSLEEVVPGLFFGSTANLDEVSGLVNSGMLRTNDFSFFMGCVEWQLDQLINQIESGFWYAASCSSIVISGLSQNSQDLWEEILLLLGVERKA